MGGLSVLRSTHARLVVHDNVEAGLAWTIID